MKLSLRNRLLSSRSLFFASLFVFSTPLCAQVKCSCHELLWKDHDIQVFRLVVQPQTSSLPFWHNDDYTFIPLTDQETLESVQPGETRSPFRNAKDGPNSWVVRDSKIRFVHPRQTEPRDAGQVIFNPSERPYIAMEILSNKPTSLPTLSTRLSLFGPPVGEDQKWALGPYSISIQSLAPSEEIKFQPGLPVAVMPASAVKFELGLNEVSLKVGDLLSLAKDLEKARNLTKFPTRVAVLYKTAQPVLMASSR